MNSEARVYVAGHTGLVGSAIVRRLQDKGYKNLILKTRQELDLGDQKAVQEFFNIAKPEYVILAAARVGGILANNTYPAEFIHQNLVIQNNIIHEAWQAGVQRLLFLGSSCTYPRDCPQPMKEEYLLSGPLEATNRPYAMAKIAGIEMCWAYNRQYGTQYLSVMPTNTYGPGDNYDLETSHVLPALIRKMHEAKVNSSPEVIIWGTGKPRREFIYSDDLANACVFILEQDEDTYSNILSDNQRAPLINIGCGKDKTIKYLAEVIQKVVEYEGQLSWDTEKPDGTPKKLLDISRLSEIGWHSKLTLEEGLARTYQYFQAAFK